jgi:hypothetical protein
MPRTTRSQYAVLCNDTYHDLNYINPKSIGCELIDSKSFSSGLYVELYKNNINGELVVAARGTAQFSDLSSDIGLALHGIPPQYTDFRDYVDSVRKYYAGTEVSITGHSLGGAFVQLYDAEMALTGGTQIAGTTFGAPGTADVVHDNWLTELAERGYNLYNMDSFAETLAVYNNVRVGDPFAIGKQLGKTTVFPKDGYYGLDAHRIINYYNTSEWYQQGGVEKNSVPNYHDAAGIIAAMKLDGNPSAQKAVDTFFGMDGDQIRSVQGVAHEYLLAPDDPTFIDATLSSQDMANGYALEENEYGVRWRITASGRVHPDDVDKYQKQYEYYEKLHSDTILRALPLEKTFKKKKHENSDYIPIANLPNTIKKESSGTDFEGIVATLGHIKDNRNNVFWDFSSFGVDVLKGIGLGKMGVSILGEEADLFKDTINTGEFKELSESMQFRNDE